MKKCASIDMSPVDYVSRVICEVVLANDWNGPLNFNVVNPNPYPYHKLFERIGQFGYHLTHLPYVIWRQKFLDCLDFLDKESKSSSRDSEPNALLPVAAQFTEQWTDHLENPVYCQTNVRDAIHGKVTFPDLDKLVNVYLSYFIRCEFIKPPQGHASSKQQQFDWGAIGSGVQRLTRTNRNS
eukprot:TRINITY_DN5145_c0_g1_i1.p1 TRINITY_DN5145_c0_g1~~TRINITY_DN5145_c0_g1_i1.p1  ORF type:complete len:182 (-),score=30.09 TRINITY_DN5145_c0_g1_i1:41-586(-)